MIPNENVIILFRFGEQRWIDKNIDGELSFSCAGSFINQAKRTGNTVQGDLYEAVFARLLKSDSKIDEMKNKLGKDLEIIDDDEYVLLRRKSAKLKPIFCFYGYKAADMLEDGNIEHVGPNKIRHDFDERLYSGFADSLKVKNVVSESHRFTQLTLMPKPFVDRVKLAMACGGYGYEMHAVDYKERGKETFFIEPTNKYLELFYKHPNYAYQYETRICITSKKFSTITERFALNIGQLQESEYKKTYQPMYMVFDAIIKKRNKSR